MMKINKPKTDSSSYDFFKLENGLQVLLISDPNSDKSAASLTVRAGSFNDPREVLGLAHFTEHTILMGSEKYPSEIEFAQFISSHSGIHNAMTDNETTTFFFSINPEFLEPALDRFCWNLKSPLFNPDSVEREANAIHSEFMKNRTSDNWRILGVFSEIGNQEHPISKFRIGNLETLKGIPVLPNKIDLTRVKPEGGLNILTNMMKNDGRTKIENPIEKIEEKTDENKRNLSEILFNFWKTHYGSDQMCLCVFGNQNLEVLKELVTKTFKSLLPTTELMNLTYKSPKLPLNDNQNLFKSEKIPELKSVFDVFSDSQFKNLLNIVSISENRKIYVMFPFILHSAQNRSLYGSKPIDIIGYLLGSESKYSLASTLKARKLITGLNFVDCFFKGVSGFRTVCLSISLREGDSDSFSTILQILAFVFEFTSDIKKNGIPDHIIEDIKSIFDTNFDYKEMGNAAQRVISIPKRMMKFLPEDILSGGWLLTEEIENAKKLAEDIFKSSFHEENCILVHVSKEKRDFLKLEQANSVFKCEKYFGTEYQMVPFDIKKEIKIMREKMIEKEPKIFEDVKITPKNPFICKNFDLKLQEFSANETQLPPVKVTSDEESKDNSTYFQIWNATDNVFRQPKTSMDFAISLPGSNFNYSPLTKMISEFFFLLFKEYLEENITHAAGEAGYGIDLALVSSKRVSVKIFGFSDKIEEVAEEVFKNMGEIASKLFEIAQQNLEQNEKNLKNFANFSELKEFETEFSKRFQLMKEKKIRNCLLMTKSMPFQILSMHMTAILHEDAPFIEEIITALENINFQQMINFIPNIFSRWDAQVQFYGNVLENDAKRITSNIQTHFFQNLMKNLPIPAKVSQDELLIHGNTSRKLPKNSDFFVFSELPKPNEDNCCVCVIYQVGKYDNRKYGIAQLLNLMITQEFFDSLRNKQQFGYIVNSRLKYEKNSLSYIFSIQSNCKKPMEIFKAIHEFVEKTIPLEILPKKLEKDTIETLKKSLAFSFLEKPKIMGLQALKFFSEIVSEHYQFDRNENVAKIVENLNADDVLKFFEKYFITSTDSKKGKKTVRRLICCVHPLSQSQEIREKITSYKDEIPEIIKDCYSSERNVKIFDKKEEVSAYCGRYPTFLKF